MSRSAVVLVLLVAVSLCACASVPTPNPGVTFIEASDDRTKHPDRYFAHEYARLNERRKNFGFEAAEGIARPPKIVGLALSGGGIRSNAFQMGVLAGLQAERLGKATLLDRVDYVSSVSGGTWANAALWAWPGEDLTSLFACLDAIALGNESPAGCDGTSGLLRNTQRARWIPTPFSGQRKEIWEQDIAEQHLPRCNPHLDEALPENCLTDVFLRRPYFIINSTHDAPNDHPSEENFPLEVTPDRLTTVVDRGSARPGVAARESQPAGFSLDFHRPDAARWHRRKFFRALLPGGGDGLEPGAQLSRTAAHSSAVVQGFGGGLRALFLDFYFQLSQGRQAVRDPRLRRRYVVADGGKSDNTGLVPLVDRGADVVVASYMGKEDPDRPFGDLELAAGQARRLFDCTIGLDTNLEELAFERSYDCPSSPDKRSKSILHVHPWPSNIEPFMEKLRTGSAGERELHDFLVEDRTIHPENQRFPQTRTFQFEYDPRLIRAYYLLGKFVAADRIATFLREEISQP